MTRLSTWALFCLLFSGTLLANSTPHDLSAGTLVASAVVDNNVTVNGGNDGQATASATGGVTPYTYSWSNGAASATNSGLSAGTYTVTVTDNGGQNSASDTATITITEPAALVASAVVDNGVSVNGGADGQATASAVGGVTPYVYLWSNGAITAINSNLSAGTYTVTVTDNNGLGDTDTASVIIFEPPPAPLAASAVVDNNVSVNGGNDGQATASATGGLTPYIYRWSNGANTAVNSDLAAGTYIVTVTGDGGKGDIDTASVTISEPPPAALVASAVVDNNVSVNGGNDGQATASATGGVTPYLYLWSNSANTATITGVPAGTYTVTVTDGGGQGATDTASVTITEPTALVASAVVDNNVTVNGGNDGQATASATGGVTPYLYLWSNSANTATITGVPAGTYTVTVTDDGGQGATDTASVTITEPPPAALVASAVVDNNVSVNGGNDGQATASATGGNTPYVYAWSNGVITATNSSLVAGTYTVTVTDNGGQGATDTASVTITEPMALVASAVVDNNVSVNGGNDGQATASATGGVTPYVYLWSNGVNTASITDLTAGTYTVTITDDNGTGDTDTASVTITEPVAVLATITTVVNESSPGAADGSASVSASGGTAPYTYLWSNGDTTATITGLTVGTYSVVVTDDNGASSDPAVAGVGVVGAGVIQPVPMNSAWMLALMIFMMLSMTLIYSRKH